MFGFVFGFGFGVEHQKPTLTLIPSISLGGLIMKSSVDFLPYLRQAIHDDLQDFVQTELARPLRKAMKRKKPVKDVMLVIRDIAGDWLNQEAQDDYKQTKKEILNVRSSTVCLLSSHFKQYSRLPPRFIFS